MKVKCKINNLNNINNPSILNRLKKNIHIVDSELCLKIGNEYVVYGILFWDNSPWVYICEDPNDFYPVPNPIELFEVSDNHFSKYWKLAYSKVENDGSYSSCELVIDVWKNNKFFYERLVDGREEEVKLFKKYKSLIDNEISGGA